MRDQVLALGKTTGVRKRGPDVAVEGWGEGGCLGEIDALSYFDFCGLFWA
jgi:hypothetical protein